MSACSSGYQVGQDNEATTVAAADWRTRMALELELVALCVCVSENSCSLADHS